MRTSRGMPRWPIPRPPGSRTRSVRACQGLRPRRVEPALALSRRLMLPSAHKMNVGTREASFSRFNGWPTRSPVNASRTASRPPAHELGANVDRYSFIAMDLHHLLLAGLPAHLALTPEGPDSLSRDVPYRDRTSCIGAGIPLLCLTRPWRNAAFGCSLRKCRSVETSCRA